MPSLNRFISGLVFLFTFCSLEHASGAHEVKWKADRTAVEVTGLEPAELAALSTAQWTEKKWAQALTVTLLPAAKSPNPSPSQLPPMLGRWEVIEARLRFTPRFSLLPGNRYRAAFSPQFLPTAHGDAAPPIEAICVVPAMSSTPTTCVARIHPTVDVLPENLLKFYVHFSAPMSGGRIYQHIHLVDAEGQDVELPFLEIDEELWDREMKRLTLFIDPGRIKREVKPLEEIGPALREGQSYTLRLDAAWPDAQGQPLTSPGEKKFRVGPPDRMPPQPQQWRIHAPRATSQAALRLDFAEPMDFALAHRLITIQERDGFVPVSGDISVADDGRSWSFVPQSPWQNRPYRVIVDSNLEDLAGNSPGRPFETDLEGDKKERHKPEPTFLEFTTRP